MKILRLYGYATASTDSAAFVIGGMRTRTVAQFQNNKWLKIGDLKEAKFNLSAIFLAGEYLIVGGRLVNSPVKHVDNRLVNSQISIRKGFICGAFNIVRMGTFGAYS